MLIIKRMEIDSPLLFNLPVELLSKIAYYCFKEFRTGSRFMNACAFPWNSLKKTQANYIILYGIDLGSSDAQLPEWELGDICKTLNFAEYSDNNDLRNILIEIWTPLMGICTRGS